MRTLIAEDETVSQMILKRMFSNLGTCEVAQDGEEALRLYQLSFNEGTPFQLICLDIMMPKLDGQGVLQSIRNFEREHNVDDEKKVKIIMTTSLNDAKNVVSSFQMGCEGYITKPIDRSMLLSELRKLGLSDEADLMQE